MRPSQTAVRSESQVVGGGGHLTSSAIFIPVFDPRDERPGGTGGSSTSADDGRPNALVDEPPVRKRSAEPSLAPMVVSIPESCFSSPGERAWSDSDRRQVGVPAPILRKPTVAY